MTCAIKFHSSSLLKKSPNVVCYIPFHFRNILLLSECNRCCTTELPIPNPRPQFAPRPCSTKCTRITTVVTPRFALLFLNRVRHRVNRSAHYNPQMGRSRVLETLSYLRHRQAFFLLNYDRTWSALGDSNSVKLPYRGRHHQQCLERKLMQTATSSLLWNPKIRLL